MYIWALKLIVCFERFDVEDSRTLGISNEVYKREPKPTVLIFLPGINEIREMYRTLEQWRNL